MLEPLEYEFFRRALAAGLLASVACGIAGTLIVVKRIASMSGGLAHAAFGGVGLGYWLGFPPILGAGGFGVLAALLLGVARRRVRAGLDSLIAIVWAIGMALGIVFIALTPGYAPDLLTYLFGSILFVPLPYVWAVLVLDVLILAALAIFYRPVLAVAFDERQARISALPVTAIFCGLLVVVALAIVTLIRVVGIVLVIALLTLPATVARQWARGIPQMMALASAIGAASVVVGLFGSWYWELPPGPLIVLAATLWFVLSQAIRR